MSQGQTDEESDVVPQAQQVENVGEIPRLQVLEKFCLAPQMQEGEQLPRSVDKTGEDPLSTADPWSKKGTMGGMIGMGDQAYTVDLPLWQCDR